MDTSIGFQFRFNVLMSPEFIDWESVGNLLRGQSLLGVAEGHEKQIVDQEVPRDPLSLKQVVQVIFNKIGQEAIQKLLYPRDRIIGLHIVKMLSIFNDQTEISNIISPTIQIDEDFSEEHRYDLLELIYCVEQLFCTYSKENFLSTFGNLQLAKKSFTIAAKEGTEPSTFYIAPSCLIPKEAN